MRRHGSERLLFWVLQGLRRSARRYMLPFQRLCQSRLSGRHLLRWLCRKHLLHEP